MIALLFFFAIQAAVSPSARAQNAMSRIQSSDGGDNSTALAQLLAHRDLSYGSTLNSAPTGVGPESKLWWNAGSWWGNLYNPAAQAFHIYRLDNASHTWVDSGTALDDRPGSKADVLWDGVNQKLYVMSHLFNSVGQATTSASEWGRLYRFSFSEAAMTYRLDEGFPVAATHGASGAVTIAKDSRGVLWVTYVENKQLMINHSTTSDLNWGTPFALLAGSAAGRLASDDLSAAITFQGDKLGVMWSNQANGTFSFAVHNDGDADSAWQHVEMALGGTNSVCSGACARPSINLKTDGTGRVFAAVTTALASPSDAPRTMLLVRDMTGGWTNHVFGTASENHGNPMLLVDEEAGQIHMFASSPASGGVIYEKTSDLNNIEFSSGIGNAFMHSSTDMNINNATSSKQNVSSATGLVVQASDHNTRYYLSATVLVVVAPTISSFSPTSAFVNAGVTITGSGFTGATAVAFNGTAATFTVTSDTQIRTKVPSGATSGKITVTTPGGIATSSASFAVKPHVISISPTTGIMGTAVTITGNAFTGATKVNFNGTPATFTVVSYTQINTTVPGGATTGAIGVTTPAGTDNSPTFTVTSTAAPTISSFSPTSGPIHATVTITGTHFTGVTAVAFNGTASTAVIVTSDTQLTAKVPLGALTGKITVTNTVGTAISSASFTVKPQIISFSPTSGSLGAAVTITGTAFTGATKVTFNGTSAAFTVVSYTQITTSVPSGATTGHVGVTASGITDLTKVNFTVISTAAPTISSFSHASGPVGQTVTITGTHFTGTTAVKFNGTASTAVIVSSDTLLTAKVPSGATSGPITVTNTVGTATSSTSFTVTPHISSFSPTSGSLGAAVTITGTSFTGATAVTFNGTPATFTVVSSTQITTSVPAGATTGKIKVTTPSGSDNSSASFTVKSTAAPTISSFSPSSGPVGTTVIITGTHFTGATAVKFNVTAATFTVTSDTQISATVPLGATTGKISVTNSVGTASSASSYTVM